jgi:VWFA-related protein
MHTRNNLRLPRSAVALIPIFLGFTLGAFSQDEPRVSISPPKALRGRSPSPPANLKLDVSLVLVPVSVTDSTDKPVSDLTPSAFRVFEDNVEQKVLSVHQEDGPVSVGFIVDTSSSMKTRMEPTIAAMRQFLKTSTQGDEYFLIRFADQPSLVTGFTRDPDEILSSMSSLQPLGWTALNDAICLGIQKVKHGKNPRRALFVLSDGGDNNSRYSDSEVRSIVRESDVRVYSIGIFERPEFLEKLGMDSGGRAFWAHKLKDLPDVVEKLSRDLRNQYVLGYSPGQRPRDGKYRKVRVEVVDAIKHMPLNVFWRRGYFSPGD